MSALITSDLPSAASSGSSVYYVYSRKEGSNVHRVRSPSSVVWSLEKPTRFPEPSGVWFSAA